MQLSMTERLLFCCQATNNVSNLCNIKYITTGSESKDLLDKEGKTIEYESKYVELVKDDKVI